MERKKVKEVVDLMQKIDELKKMLSLVNDPNSYISVGNFDLVKPAVILSNDFKSAVSVAISDLIAELEDDFDNL